MPSREVPGGGAGDGVPTGVVSSEVVYQGKVVTLRVDTITLPGSRTALREVVEHPGAVVVAAVDSAGEVFLVKQYRHAVGGELVELPAGALEADEEPLLAAQRELREEAGLIAEDWTYLGSFFSSPGFANERLHAFLARGLTHVDTDPDEDEDLTILKLPLEDLLSRTLGITDAKTLATLLLVRRELDERPSESE